MSDTLDEISRELGIALSPIKYALQSPERIRLFVQELGWNLPEGTSSIGIDPSYLTNVISALERLSESEFQNPGSSSTLTNYSSLVSSIGNFISHLSTQSSRIRNILDANFISSSNIDRDLPRRLFDYLLIEYIHNEHESLYYLLVALGIFELRNYDADNRTFTSNHIRRIIRFDRLTDLFADPIRLFRDVYGWGTPIADLSLLLERLNDLFFALGISSYLQFPVYEKKVNLYAPAVLPEEEESEIPELRIPILEKENTNTEVGVTIFPLRPLNSNGLPGLSICPYGSGDITELFPLDDMGQWYLKLDGSLDLRVGIGIIIRPDENIKLITDILGSASEQRGSFFFELQRQSMQDENLVIFNVAGLFSLIAKDVYVKAGIEINQDNRPEIIFQIGVRNGKFTISSSRSDSFIRTILPSNLEIDFDLGIGWSNVRGVYFTGTGSLETNITTHKVIGPLTIRSTNISLRKEGQSMLFAVSVSGNIQIGPIEVSADKLGFLMEISSPPSNGNMGPLDIQPQFKPPDGLGIKIDSSLIVGGGYLFFDHQNQQYAGVLQLKISDIALSAVGLLTTRMPDGSAGFSLLVIITAEGFTPIQLGFGFKLTGVGGLIGINRTVAVDVLQAGLRNNTLNSILFPRDIIRNAPRIISDLRNVFPPSLTRHIFGPIGIIEWGTPTIITAKIGLALEVPSPIRLIVLGQLKMVLPKEEEAVVRVNVDVLGVIDFDRKSLSVDARLRDSRIAIFDLTGDIALRLNWGDNPNFLLSAGGFNPHFQPPAGFPSLDRLAIRLASGDNPRIRLEAYLALTSNTVQIGARLELYAAALGFSIEGYLSFDALFQFSPFQFIIDIDAGVAVKAGSATLLMVQLSLSLSGPSPWHVRGRATFEILFLSVTVSFDERLTEDEPPVLEAVDPMPQLISAISDTRSWSAQLPRLDYNMFVTFRRVPESGSVLVHPLGTITLRQQVLPLNVNISRFGNTDIIGDIRRFAISNVYLLLSSDNVERMTTQTVEDYFAPSQYLQMTDDEKLSRPSFEKMQSGITITSNNNYSFTSNPSHIQEATLSYEEEIIDRRQERKIRLPVQIYTPTMDNFLAMSSIDAASLSAIHNTGINKFKGPDLGVYVEDTKYFIVDTTSLNTKDIEIDDKESYYQDGVPYIAAFDALEKHLSSAHPAEPGGGNLQIVSDFEKFKRDKKAK